MRRPATSWGRHLLATLTLVLGCAGRPPVAEPEPETAAGSTAPGAGEGRPALATAVSPPAPEPAAEVADGPPVDEAGMPLAVERLDPASAYTPGSESVISLERTACFGRCPVYSLAILGDGSVHFWGGAHTAAVGYRTANIPLTSLPTLYGFLREKHLHLLHNRYAATGTDHPTVVVTLRHGRAMKRIEHDTSNETSLALFHIEDEIDRVAGTAAWLKHPDTAAGDAARAEAHRAAPTPIPPAAVRALLGSRFASLSKCGPDPRTKSVRLAGAVDTYGRMSLGVFPPGARGACLFQLLREPMFPLPSIPHLDAVLPLSVPRPRGRGR